MFALNDDEIAAIQAAYASGGEFAAAVELRRLFPGISDIAHAQRCAMAIVGWTPPAPNPAASKPAAARSRRRRPVPAA